MNERSRNLLKKMGIVGFLFFLLKGILWLVFGTTLYKWIKELLIVLSATLLPVIAEAQTPHFSCHEFKLPYLTTIQVKKPLLWINEIKVKPFFCRLEDQLNENKKTYIKFRLGSMEYSNQLEYSMYLYKKETENLFLR